MSDTKKIGITELVLRDAHQSLFATRMRLDDMLPIAEKLDQMGYWSVESWGGATFDSCIRFLGEDPWERIRKIKEAMPNTRQQMLFRGQNILGYRHYADDVVEKFVERAAVNGVDVFRVFDAMNDMRNIETAVKAVMKVDKHAQGTLSYTTSEVHTLDLWSKLAGQIQDMGAHSICIKDMAGLLKPYDAYELVSRLKQELDIPIHLHCHATTGLSTPTLVKAIEAGADVIDTSISSMSATYGHTATETMVAIQEGQERETGLDINKLEEIAAYFREVRKKYAKFEGALKGIDSRILVAQVPGGMLTNMENQLREQNASDKLDAVLEEIPRVREDLGFIPLVTPTSQIVGTQSVLNVLTGERYKTVTKEAAGILKGEYGSTPAPVNKELQERVLDGGTAITGRPADDLEPEVEKLTAELKEIAAEKNIKLADAEIDDVLTYALFPQIGLKFLENRDNPDAFEPVPSADDVAPAAKAPAKTEADSNVYTVTVAGQSYVVQVDEGGDITQAAPVAPAAAPAAKHHAPVAASAHPSEASAVVATAGDGEPVPAPLGGHVFKIPVSVGQQVAEGEVVVILEAMKMETEIRATHAGIVSDVCVKEGDTVAVGDTLIKMS